MKNTRKEKKEKADSLKKEYLFQMYVTEGKYPDEIAIETNISRFYIIKKLKEFGIYGIRKFTGNTNRKRGNWGELDNKVRTENLSQIKDRL